MAIKEVVKAPEKVLSSKTKEPIIPSVKIKGNNN